MGGFEILGIANPTYLKPIPSACLKGFPSYNIAGGWVRFTHCELIRRGSNREIVTADEAKEESPIYFEKMVAPRESIFSITGVKPTLMGILNVTPDSFSDGGLYVDSDKAIAHSMRMLRTGAEIIDVGGESTRPGATAVDPALEWERVEGIINRLADEQAILSTDTRRADIMKVAASAGVSIINDISGFKFDSDSADTVAKLAMPAVIVHSRGQPNEMLEKVEYGELLPDVFDELSDSLERALRAGIDRKRIILDPGIGFAKTSQQSLSILRDIGVFHNLGCLVMIGASRKSFIADLADCRSPEDRLPGSLGAALWAVEQGVQVLRVHDVSETAQALKVWASIRNWGF